MLSDDEATQRRILDLLPALVMMSDADGTVTFFNERWHRFTGQPQFVRDPGDAWPQYIHPDDRPRVAAEWATAVALGRNMVDMEYRLRSQSGEYVWVHAKATAITDEAGTVTGWLGIAMDIEEHRQRQYSLQALYSSAHTVATAMQRAALPVKLPELDGLTFAASYEPSRADMTIGGDWYDAFALSDGSVALSIGDVRGHGLEAAILMSKIRYSIRVLTVRAMELQTGTSASILRSVEEGLATEHPAASATAFLGIISPDHSTLCYSNAGHPPPLVVPHEGPPSWLELGDPPLCWRFGEARSERTTDLAGARHVVLYTDGLVDADRDIIAGMERLFAVARRAGVVTGEELLRDLTAMLSPVRMHHDDVAVLLATFHRTNGN